MRERRREWEVGWIGRGRGRDGWRQAGRHGGIFPTHAHVRTYTYRLILFAVDVFCYIHKRMYACMHMHAGMEVQFVGIL